jgi:hypothetical protein
MEHHQERVLEKVKELERMRQFEDWKFFSHISMDELWEIILDLRVIIIKATHHGIKG